MRKRKWENGGSDIVDEKGVEGGSDIVDEKGVEGGSVIVEELKEMKSGSNEGAVEGSIEENVTEKADDEYDEKNKESILKKKEEEMLQDNGPRNVADDMEVVNVSKKTEVGDGLKNGMSRSFNLLCDLTFLYFSQVIILHNW